jgi:hypothetical protein
VKEFEKCNLKQEILQKAEKPKIANQKRNSAHLDKESGASQELANQSRSNSIS